MNDTYLRKANINDMDLLFRWANDESVRNNAFNTEEIKYEDHKKWLIGKLNSDNSVIYIYCQGDVPIGQIRIDNLNGDSGVITYSIDSAFRLRGHAGKLLTILDVTVKTDMPKVKTLYARVKKDNIASQRKFEQQMYKKTEKEDYFEYTKKL